MFTEVTAANECLVCADTGLLHRQEDCPVGTDRRPAADPRNPGPGEYPEFGKRLSEEVLQQRRDNRRWLAATTPWYVTAMNAWQR